MERFLSCLHGKIVCRDVEDTMLWTTTKSDKFTVNSLYNALEPDNFKSYPMRGIGCSIGSFFFCVEVAWGKVLTLNQV